MHRPRTLAIDCGGSGLKATVLGPDGRMLTDRVRVHTPYPWVSPAWFATVKCCRHPIT